MARPNAQQTRRTAPAVPPPDGPPSGPEWEEGDQGFGADLPNPNDTTGLVMTRTDPALVKAELETFAAIARGLTRDPEQALKSALAELELSAKIDPGHLDERTKRWKDGFADAQYYVIDYGGGEKPVTGLSYKASLILARHWGGLIGTARIVAETDDYIDAEGVAMQFSPVFILRRSRRESKWYRPRGSRKLVRIREDLMPQVHGRCQSKAQRNAFLAVIPHAIQTVYWNRCKQLVAGIGRGMPKVDVVKAMSATLTWLEARGVTLADVERKLGHPLTEITKEEYADFRGLINAIASGETTAARAFNLAEDSNDEAPPIDDDPTAGSTVTT